MSSRLATLGCRVTGWREAVVSQPYKSDVTVLGEMADDIDQAADAQKEAARSVRVLGDKRSAGASWAALMEGGIFRKTLSSLLDSARRVRDDAGRLRRTAIGGLAEEGLTVRQIGHLFEVSHQRISAILAKRTGP